MTSVTLAAAILALYIALVVFWANPTRFANQIFSGIWLIFTAWFGLVHQATAAENILASGGVANPSPWLRANAALIACAPSLIWLLKESIASGEDDRWSPLRRSVPVFLVTPILFALCYSDSFVLEVVDGGMHRRGLAYSLYITIELCIYTCLLIDSWRQIRQLRGIRRLELQLLAVTTGTTCLIATSLVGIGNLLPNTSIRWSTFFVLLGGFTITAWAITAHRIFDTKQVLTSIAQRAGVIIGSALAAVYLVQLLTEIVSTPVAIFLGVVTVGSIGFWADRKSRQWFKLSGEHILARMRTATIDLARTEPNPHRLVTEFERLLQNESQASWVTLLFDEAATDHAAAFGIGKDSPTRAALCELGWATPEALQRRRATTASDVLKAYLTQRSIALVVAAPHGSPNPSLIVALGTRRNEWPFTYPEVQRIQNIAELMDNILTRSRLTTQAALKAKTEHLAMMSRGLAHDLKNLLTPVSSFLIHTDGRFPPESTEAEVHSAALRSVRIMGDYVREARFFSEQLTPQFERISLERILQSVRELMHERAAARAVTITLSLSHDREVIVDRVLIQRMLGNLVANAIDASSSGQTVVLSGEQKDRLRFQVIDQGCGIAPEHLGRIFEAYFTTKEFGDEVRGFGLGLTICQKIAALHGGEISCRSELGQGSTFTVELPSAPATSAANMSVSAGAGI